MQRTDALNDLLEDLSAHFNDGERVDVKFDSKSYASPNGTVAVAPNVREMIGKNLDGPDELRVVVDTLSHEIEHIRESELTAKQDFMDDYPNYPKVAGAVINIVEDQFIDWKRGRRFRGMRKTRAFTTDAMMSNGHRCPPLDTMESIPQQCVEGLLQVAFAGYAKGIGSDDVPDKVREFLAYARLRVDDARRESDPDEREAIARELTERMIEIFPPKPDIDTDALEALIDNLQTDDVDAEIPDSDVTDDNAAENSIDENTIDDLTIDPDQILSQYDPDDLTVVD